MEPMEFFTSPDPDPDLVQNPSVFQTVRVETDALPPLVELGRKLLIKAQDGDAEAVRHLMRQGAPFTTDWLGTSAIHLACQLNHLEVARILLKAGISRDARNKVDRTPLHVTAQEGHIAILKLLLEYGVDVDAIDMLKMTPLHWASEFGHDECVRLLLEHGADPIAVNKFDKTADQIAFDNNRLDITHIIQEYAENPLRNVRRKAAKQKQQQAAAAHKVTLDLERIIKPPAEPREPRMQKVVKKKTPTKVLFESNLKCTNVLPTTKDSDATPADNENTEKALAMLQAHGITMLPADESTIVESAVQSGQKVVLTEAGKMALNLTEKPVLKPQTSLPVKGLMKLPPEMFKGKRVITIRADQLINMKKENKVIIQTDKRFKPTPTMIVNKPKPVEVIKPTIEVVVRKTKVNNQTHLTSSYVKKQPEPIIPDSYLEEAVAEQKRVEEESEVDRIKRELEEAKKQVETLKEQFMKKEEEAQKYKRILEVLHIT